MIEGLRSLLDSALKPIRQAYLRIQDHAIIRNKIKHTLFDPQNEVKSPERWRVLSLAAPLDMIGLFELIKDQDISLFCESQEECDILTTFIEVFREFRKLATDIDTYIFEKVGTYVNSTYTPYWNKVGEYSKLRLFGLDKKSTEKRIVTWNVAEQVGVVEADCEQVYEILQTDQDLEKLILKLLQTQQQLERLRTGIYELKGFQ